MGSDGASVMTGKKGGVITLLRSEQGVIVGIHCYNHKLELSYTLWPKVIRHGQSLSPNWVMFISSLPYYTFQTAR